MKFVSVAEIAKKWNVSDRMVRNYCAEGRIPGAFQTGRTWNIPEDAVKPAREPGKQFSDNKLLNVLKEQKDSGLRGGI
ncbi:MAG: helix-turn-helix domain-containing protein, partial [Eubacteriales bacterium]|nr:helix-turn-helix domain-containing protein [Eubacteriales bacterium]